MANDKKLLDGVIVTLTDEEQAVKDNADNLYASQSSERKILEIRQIRLQKLIETDYLANSDMTMPDNIKTWRQSLRDIPQDFTTESKYDLLLARDSDGKLTHSVWNKP
mgnify:CR=1 FL=1|tara:strand:- start:46 stop:369 length:324 start_codon:yes stop_codon:yes gene_type:complete